MKNLLIGFQFDSTFYKLKFPVEIRSILSNKKLESIENLRFWIDLQHFWESEHSRHIKQLHEYLRYYRGPINYLKVMNHSNPYDPPQNAQLRVDNNVETLELELFNIKIIDPRSAMLQKVKYIALKKCEIGNGTFERRHFFPQVK